MAVVSVRRGKVVGAGATQSSGASYQTLSCSQTTEQVATDLSVGSEAVRRSGAGVVAEITGEKAATVAPRLNAALAGAGARSDAGAGRVVAGGAASHKL